MSTNTKQVMVYKLAQGYSTKHIGGITQTWDYTIHYLPEREQGILCIGEGCGREGFGGWFTCAEALQPMWRPHFVKSQGEWLLPLLESLPPGQNPTFTDVMEAYRKAHGALPLTEVWPIDVAVLQAGAS